MFKTLLVGLSGTKRDDATLATALQLARPFSGHLDCLSLLPEIAVGGSEQKSDGDLEGRQPPNIDRGSKDDRHHGTDRMAYARMVEFCDKNNVSMKLAPNGITTISAAWRDSLANTREILREVRVHDCAVISGGSSEATNEIIFGGGKPVVLAPERPPAGDIKVIAIAWKDTAESASAVTAALPLLHNAHRIEILTVSEYDEKNLECIHCVENVAKQLRWHGLHPFHRFVLPEGRSVPEAILQTAYNVGADLLVMGSCNHNALREFLFGGVTNRVLQGVDIPVLLVR